MIKSIELISNWKDVLRKAYVIRFIIIAGILTGLEMILPFIESITVSWFWLVTLKVITFVVVALAFIFRLIAQEGLSKKVNKTEQKECDANTI